MELILVLSVVPDAYKTPPWWVPRRGHNDVLQGNEPEYIRRMRTFLEILDNFIRHGWVESVPVTPTQIDFIRGREIEVENAD